MEGGRPQPEEAEGGGDAAAHTPSETQLAHARPWFLRGLEELHFTSGAFLRQQLEEEMREVQNYVDHVRALTEARDALAAEYEWENKELRTKLTQLQLEHESQHKEVAELLALEGLASIVHSSPSEQVAYLLVERSSLLERMEALEQELGAPHCLGRPCAASLRVQDVWHLFHPRSEEGLQPQPQQPLRHIRGTLPSSGEPGGGQPVWEEAERALEGAPDRLRSTQDGIPALKEDPDIAEGERGKLRGSAGAEEIWQATVPGKKEEEGAQKPCEPLNRNSSLPRDPHSSALDPDSGKAERRASLGGSGASREAASDLGGCFKHELHGYKSELLRLYGELQGLPGAAEERDFLLRTHRKLLQKNRRLEAQVLELSHECERLNQRILREREEEEEKEEGVSCPKFPTREQVYEDQSLNQGGDGEPMGLRLSEASQMGEQGKPGQAKQEEEEEEEEAPSTLKEILAVRHQLSPHRERPHVAAQPCPSAGGATEEQGQELEWMLQEESQAALGRRWLEEAAREAKEAEAQRSLQEEERTWRRQWAEQQQQLRAWREKEAQLLQALADRQAQAQRQEAQLGVLEEERRALAKEHLFCRSHSQRLSEQLSALQQEKEALCEEQRRVLKQVDLSLRKQSERRLRHKARLRQAKETLLGEVKLRDTRIWHLENEVRLCKSQAEQDQLLIQRVTGENESLLREKRKTLEQLHSLEEAKQSNGQALCTLQSRVQLLERENQQLQDRSLQLSLQVGILERALHTIHIHSLEELKSLGFPKCPLQRKLLPFPGFSFSVTRLLDAGGLRQALKDGQPVEPKGPKALLSPPGIGYFNGPRKLADFCEDLPGHPVG